MYISRWILGLILLGVLSSGAKADSVDPKFVPIGGCCSVVINSMNDFSAFTFGYQFGTTATTDCGNVHNSFFDQGRTCIDPTHTNLSFINNTGHTWTSLTLEFTKISGLLIFSPTANANTIDPYYNNSTFGIDPITENPFVRFFGLDATHPGILPAFGCEGNSCSGPTANDGQLRLYDVGILADVSDAQHVGDAFTANGTATAAPEPATVLLALAGGLLLFLFKRT
jgi:hypothetical protein